MARKPGKKKAKAMNPKQMKKTAGGFTAYPHFSGGVTVAAGDVNGDGTDALKARPPRGV